jgi:DNA-directed RNA polymerase
MSPHPQLVYPARVGLDPVDPGLIWRQGIKAKEPFQFAAACIEYVAADTHGSEYVTHLPVWLDASSNGLQHLCGVM